MEAQQSTTTTAMLESANHQRHDSNLRPRRTTLILRVPEVKTPEKEKGSKTFWQQQPYLVTYSGAMSLVAPVASAYQLCKLYQIQKPTSQLLKMSLSIFPHQTCLKLIQMNTTTPIKEYCNPWIAFGCLGVLQGAVYGQSNIHFSRVMQLGTTTNSAIAANGTKALRALSLVTGLFRGSLFAGMRDCISQGIPFMFSSTVKTEVLDKVWDTTSRTTDLNKDDEFADSIKHWTSILSTSIFSTYLSQGVHNFQIAMQTNPTLTYRGAVESVLQKHGLRGLIRGAEARVGVLLVVNVLNELLLKPAWS